MIEYVDLRNFQTHRRVRVKLDPTVTTLIGDNEAGKTAIVRALVIACLNNHTSPDRLIRSGSAKFDITLGVDGHTVGRRKGKGTNLYLLDGKQLKFDSMRLRVPGQVSKLLNVGRENFSLQHDAHFWFSDTPGQVSKRLNELVNLGVIDSSLAAVAAGVRKAKSDLDTREGLLEESRGRVRSLRWVPRFARDAAALEGLGDAAGNAARIASAARSGVREGWDSLMASKRLSGAYTHGKLVLRFGKDAARKAEKVVRARELIRELTAAERDAKMVVPDVRPLLRFRARCDAVAEKRRVLEHGLQDLNALKETVWTAERELRKVEKRLGKTCPTCGRPLSRSSHRTGTCGKIRRLHERKKTGTRSSSGTSTK